MLEGYDLQAAGVLAPRFAQALRLNHGQVGWVFTAAAIGLFLGAALGGRVADRIGRKWVLTASLGVFGIFSLGTAFADGFPTLVSMRLLTGIGLGGALPNMIALVAESSALQSRQQRVTLLSAAIPLGGLAAVLLVLVGPHSMDWRAVFQIGGWLPLIMSAVMAFLLQESPAFVRSRTAVREHNGPSWSPPSTSTALFGNHRTGQTVLLWVSFFCTSVILYLLINWLPTLMVMKGFTPRAATIGNLAFASGSVVGSLILGLFGKDNDRRPLFLFYYGGTALSLFGLIFAALNLQLAILAAFGVGFFAIGAQFLLYGISPILYPDEVRGTGVGWAVAIGRLGAIAGPAAGGIILSNGGRAAEVLGFTLPAAAIALGAALILRTAPQRS